MKKRVAFRSFVILLAAVMLLSSTSAYNILVYANQDSVANSLSAIGSLSEDAVTEPNIAVQGGSLELNADEISTETTTVEWIGEGSEQDPYQISSAAHLMQVNKMVNATSVSADTGIHNQFNKHFKLVADIDITSLFASEKSPYIQTATNAFLVSADPEDSSSQMKYINLDGSYTDENGVPQKHKIYTDGSVEVAVKNYENFALFGYLGANSVISNVVFENINVNVTANKPQRISIISYCNDGRISDCEIINSSVTLPATSQTDGAGTNDAYYGIAGAVADNRAAVSNVRVENFTLSLSSTSSNDYIGGLVGQNRGTVAESSLSGLKMTVGGINHYVGGLVGYNAATVTGCAVDMAGDNNTTNNMYGGGYVGGLVGYNESDAVITNSSVTGSVTSAQSATSSRYNMYGTAENANSSVAYFGGIAGVNKGTVEKTTVSDLGFFMGFNSVSYTGCFGGIAAVSTGGVINNSVASGSFVAQNSTVCHAGGIIGYAQTDDTRIVNDCYALFKLSVPAVDLVGAVVGYGGNAQTAYNSYWSDAISGCFTSYVLQPNTTEDVQRPSNIEPLLGKLISYNRAVTVPKNGSVIVDYADLKHNFVKQPTASYDVASISAVKSLTVRGADSNNSIVKQAYDVTITFPSDVSGVPYIGSNDKQNMLVSVNLDVFITSALGDPDSRTNPLVISASSMSSFISDASYGHYKLSNDITVFLNTWSKSYFSGSIDGNDNTILTNTPLFKGIIGSRSELPLFNDSATVPDGDTESNLNNGVIKSLNVELSSDIQTAIFGTVYSATLVNVALTDSDPTTDDGDINTFDGFTAKISNDLTAAFINSAVGYSYIYGCSTDVSVSMSSVEHSAAFIAYVSGNVVIDNCSVLSIGAYIDDDNNTSRAVFVAHSSENTGGYILNSIVTAQIKGEGSCYIVFGEEKLSENSPRYRNITWSKMQYSSAEEDSNMNSSAIVLWGSKDKKYTSIYKEETAGRNYAYRISIPQKVSAFNGATLNDFDISLIEFGEGYNEAPYSGNAFILSTASVENGEIVLNISASDGANEGENAWVKVYHYDTGLLTYVRFTVIVKTFDVSDDGYIHISSPDDLIAFSKLTNEKPEYLGYAYKLDQDINMENVVYEPAAASSEVGAFTGRFDGNGYAIENLTIVGGSNDNTDVNVALIAQAISQDSVTVYDKNTKTYTQVDSGIYNLRILDSSVTSAVENANTALLVGLSSSSNTDYPRIVIKDIEVVGCSVLAAGKNTAAILAHSNNTDIEINNIKISNTTIQTTTSLTNEYINDTQYSAVGGLGGILGTVTDSVAQPASTHQVSISKVDVDGLSLTGGQDNTAYAMVNTGAIVGTYQKRYSSPGNGVPTLTVGDALSEEEYDITINNLLIKSTGISGGLIGSTNAQTTVDKVKVSATDGNKSQILSKTNYFIGGIAGHIGSYDADDETDAYAVANMYGVISDCLVENTEIKAEDEAIKDPENNLTRNVAVGGIVGAINGPAIGETVKNCTVKNSLVEGVVVGGIVGSNIERTVAVGNVMHISYCDVASTTIKTLDECYPIKFVLATVSPVNSAGVGGVLGTNYYNTVSYSTDVLIEYCNIDESTNIINKIPAKYGSSKAGQSATGGILGSGFQLKSTGVQLKLIYNTVQARIVSEADMNVTACWNTPSTQINNKVRVGTGGFIGMIAGYSSQFNNTSTIPNTAVYLMTIYIQDSVFDGSILGTDCIGGVIGSVVNAFGYASTSSTVPPTGLIKNVVISGELESKFDKSTRYRGGIAIGSILIAQNTPGINASIGCYNSGAKIKQTFSDIYFSSLTIDTTMFPVFSCVGATSTQGSSTSNSPTYSATKNLLKNCYTDVNCRDSANSQAQLADKTADSSFTISGENAPVNSRGMFSLEPIAELSNQQSYWQSSNSMIASVSENSIYTAVTVTPKSKDENVPVIISIDYLAVMTSDEDASWRVPVSLPVGFRLYSMAEKALDWVIAENGETYYLISDKIDLKYIEPNTNYWLKNDLVFTPEDFETGGIYDGGYLSASKGTKPFSGEFASMPKGIHTVHKANSEDTEIYNSTTNTKIISGLQLAAVLVTINYSEDTSVSYSAASLFAYAENAIFRNFVVSGFSSNVATDYTASIAAVTTGSVVAEDIVVENVNISGAKYSGGLFGGMFDAGDVAVPWNVKNCQVLGTRTGDASGYTYSSNISGINGAAGIAVHTDQKAASFTDVYVSGCCISQHAETMDSAFFDNGAAGISLAYSGTISANDSIRNTIKDCYIVGEIAAGAVMRTYTSGSDSAFTSAGIDAQVYSNVPLSISNIDLVSTIVEGNHSTPAGKVSNYMVSSSGILARVDSSYVIHSVESCTLDETTTIMAPYGVGGVLGCFEETDAVTSTEIDKKVFGISIVSCDVAATISMTNGKRIEDASNAYYFFNMGAGGIIGAFSMRSNLTETNISNCKVTGVISGPSAVGGIIGAIWTNYTGDAPDTFRLDKMGSNFVENCVVSADFQNSAGEDLFATSAPATGIIVGHVLSASASSSDSIFAAAADAGFKSDFSNQPFYNIYYSGHKYPDNATYLFGVIKPGTNTSQKSLNYSSSYDYSCYTDYIYDMDFFTENPVVIDKTDHCVVLSDVYRVQQTLSEENGIWVIDNLTFGSGKEIKLSEFTFNTAPAGNVNSALTYRFNTDASLSGFTLSDSADTTGDSVAVLENVTATTPLIKVDKVDEETYRLYRVSELTQTLVFDLVFVYSNGLELVAPFRIEVSDGDYYFAETENGTNYFVFNAANLKSTLQLTLGEDDNIIQCFDVFYTLDNVSLEDTVNDYIGDTKLSEAYAGVTFNGTDIITLLGQAKHLNPEFDATKDISDSNPQYLSIGDYLGLGVNETLGDVALRRLVKEISTVSFSRDDKDNEKLVSNLYDKDFAANYTVLKSVTEGKSTGLTEAGEYYSIYGLEIHAVNTNAQKADYTHTGLFKSLVSGATVTGLTFVNPRIEVVGAKADENYAGVLAGTASGANIKNVSVERYAEGDSAYISSIRWMTAASTNVGGIVGKADAATKIENVSVNGIDVVGASLAGSDTKSLKTVMAGGIAGSSDAVVTESSVTNSRILIERNDRYRNYYLSYAGGIAARATGTISGATVSNTVMRDCTCEVIVQDEDHSNPYSTYSCEDSALVADRIGGIAAFTDGSLTVTDAVVSGVTVRAFDITGGILAEVTDNDDAEVSVTDSSVVKSSDIRVYGSANVASVSSRRQYFNAAGGAVGKIDNLKLLNIDTFNFDGYVGTYSYDNLNKDCTAGGIIGFVTDELTTLDAIRIYNSTVSGEVAGYRTNKTGNMVPYLGAAGGIIGKINTTAVKNAADKMVSDCVMGAKVTLYNNVSGTSVNANLADPANSASTNVGKILGTLVSKVMDTETNEQVSSNFALDAEALSVYFNEIYISSYPQDIVAYGSQDFYVSQKFSPFTTYTDINKILDTQTGESTGALAVGGLDLSGVTNPSYTDDEYSELAIIPIDKEQGVAGKATRGFRVKQNSIEFGNNNYINFEGKASIVAETDIEGATIEIKTGSTLVNNDGCYYGTLHIDQVTTDIIGEIVMDYSYGLQINVQFIGMDIKGDGSVATPFKVSEPKHFAVVRVLRDKNYIQINDIDFTSQYSYSEAVPSPLWATIEGFEPIGTANAPFIGSYDGQGNLITNLYISRANTDNVGLFGYVKGTAEKQASISNVHIELAGELSLSLNENNLSDVTVVPGNITGKNNVGGLAGSAVNADITNCSVVKGNVIGSSAVGGLVGNASASKFVSDFTSTTAFAYANLSYDTPSLKTAGGLVGTVSGSLAINNSFTLGYAGLDRDSSGYNYGAVGSFAGYVDSGVLLEISNSFVGAGVSDSYGYSSNNVTYRGITVGTAHTNSNVTASNVFVSATVAEGENAYEGVVTEKLNPIVGTASGATIGENVSFDSGLNGTLPNRTEALAQPAGFTLSGIEIGVGADKDPYTAAYVEFAGVQIKVSDVETTDRMSSSKSNDGNALQYQLGGLFYPVTLIGEGLSVTSSLIDDADELDYPDGMDVDLYGNGENKKTDLLFKNTENGIKVYTNIYVFDDKVGNYTGDVYDNGELFYSNSLPYFTVEKTETIANIDYELYRKVTYPLQTKHEGVIRVYPIATERQLNALAKIETEGTFSDFDLNRNYALIENITLGNYEGQDYNFKPIVGFTGVLDGKGHTVSNIKIKQPGEDKVGFFSELTKGSVKNLHLEVNSVVGNNYVGGLVGYIGADGNSPSKVTISNCSVSSYTENSGVTGNEYVGGLVGYAVAGETAGVNSATGLEEGKAGFFNSFTDVEVSGLNVVGGLVGGSEMYITNCYSTGDVNGSINSVVPTDADGKPIQLPRGIGGLVGVLKSKSIPSAYPTTSNYHDLLNSSFSSSAVDVSSVSGYNLAGNGVGGLVGNVTTGTSIATVFSSGSVHFCYDDGSKVACGNVPALGIGGLVGVLNSQTTDVYSSASVAVRVGELTAPSTNEDGTVASYGSIVGIGGVVGISNAKLQSAYSSGSTLGETVTTDTELAATKYNYGVGGVLGLVSGNGLASANLYFDRNASAVSGEAIGTVTVGMLTSPDKVGSKSTKEFTHAEDTTFLGLNFKFTTGAYPYLDSFFADTVSEVIRFNALLSIVAVEIDDRDVSAIAGDGLSMAMTIPTAVPYGDFSYVYGFEADNSFGESATSIVDAESNTLTFQRTSNDSEPANFIVTIKEVGKKIGVDIVDGKEVPIYGNYQKVDANGVVYSSIASRPFSRVTAEMRGTKDKPYLIASQEDLEHVAMIDVPTEGMYAQWNTPNEGTKVYYRLMGYIELNEEYSNANNFSTSLTEGYVLDGNGYSIRKLSTKLADELDAKSTITNITFENVSFESNESLIGALNGSAIGINIYGTATGSNVAGIAQTVGESDTDENGNVISGLVEGCISNLDYTGSGASDIAGLVLTNNGTINMSASVGDISGQNLTDVSALVGTNGGTIKNSFTMGDIILDNPAGVVAGFVGTNTGTVENSYTRCNFKVKNVADALTIGSFAGNNSGSITASFAAGLFDVRQADASPAALSSIFAAQNSGTLSDVMFDKQLSGTCFKDIFTYAESTSDIITMSNHTALCSAEGYTRAKEANGEAYKNDEYPQLSVILATANSEDEVTARMYRALRSYSQLSTVTALVANDNYIDNVVAESTTPLTYGMMSWAVRGAATTSGAALKAKTWDEIQNLDDKSAIATATLAVEDFYNVGAAAKLSDTLNLYFTIDDDGANPNFAGGNGSEGSKYQISAPEHVIALSYYGKNASSFFEVVNDINMSGANWNNSYINIFKANLDGNGYVFSNVEIPDNTADAFIGSLEGGSISNLGLAGIKVTTSTTGASGLLAAKALNNASVTNCVVFGELNASTGSNVGGLFGETDGQTVIDGCIVSGKIKSGATYVGGLVGNAADGTVITNCLSTAVVNGGENTTATGGILGSGTATVTNTVVAGNVKGNTVGNIAGESENVTVENSYYDKQLSTVDGGANASTTHYLTAGADVADFGGDMVWITGFAGYPVPKALASSSGEMLNAVKLASARITFATGIGAGTSTTFTTATPTLMEKAVLGVSGLAASEGNGFLKVKNGSWVTDTAAMKLGQVYDGELTYKLESTMLDSLTRYVDVTVGKKVNTVNYQINGFASGNSIISAITGNGGGATAATAFDTAQQGVLCNNMVFTYDVVDGEAQLFRVETQLPNGYVQGEVTAKFNDTNNITVTVETDENGIAYIAVPTSIGVFDTIDITVEAVKVDTWGVRNLFGLFR